VPKRIKQISTLLDHQSFVSLLFTLQVVRSNESLKNKN